mgnify:CR=1 FL=1
MQRYPGNNANNLGTRDAGAQRVIVQPLGSEALEGVEVGERVADAPRFPPSEHTLLEEGDEALNYMGLKLFDGLDEQKKKWYRKQFRRIKKQLIKIRKSLSVKLKILLSFLQIVTSMGFNLSGIRFPKRYMEFTEALAFISFNFFIRFIAGG